MKNTVKVCSTKHPQGWVLIDEDSLGPSHTRWEEPLFSMPPFHVCVDADMALDPIETPEPLPERPVRLPRPSRR
jgi:hypothetical protein